MKKLLLFILTLCSVIGVKANDWTFQSLPDGGGDFYLYNEYTGMFLGRGNNYATRASVNYQGLSWKITKDGDYWSLENDLTNDQRPDHFLYIDSGNDVWTDGDKGVAYKWSINPVDGKENTYYLVSESGRYLRRSDNATYISSNSTNTDRPERFYWKLVTKDERESRKNATINKPQDMTWRIFNQNMDHYNKTEFTNLGKWTENHSGNINYRGGGDLNPCMEVWNGTFDVKQTHSNYPKGRYTLKAQGFYRVGNGKNDPSEAAKARNNGNEEINAYFYAEADGKVTKQNFCSIFDNDCSTDKGTEYVSSTSYDINGTTYYVPTTMDRASKWFSDGAYEVELTFDLPQNGSITIGAKNETDNSQQWSIFDNFRLYYQPYFGELDDLITSVSPNASNIDGLQTILDAVAENRNNLTQEQVDAYVTQIQSLAANPTVTLNCNPVNAGHVSATSLHPAAGSNITISVTPNYGYTFVNWTDGEGNVVSTELSFETTVNNDITYTANFIAPIGNTDNSSAWFTAQSSTYTIAANSAKHVSFINHCVDHGWPYEMLGILYLQDADTRGEGSHELVVTRMDNYNNANWGTKNSGAIVETTASNEGNILLNFMNNATVDMYLYRSGEYFYYTGVFSKDGTQYHKDYWTKGLPAEDDLYFFFTGEKGWMENFQVEDIDNVESVKQVTLRDDFPMLYSDMVNETVNLHRTLKQGWNTICLPFATTAEDVAGEGAEAYAFTAATAENELTFSKVNSMEANVPYLFYCETEAANPSFDNITLFAAQPATVQQGDWKFIGNYTPAMSMEGKYGVTGDKVRLAGSGSTLNGMRAYLEGPANAEARVKVNDGDEETSIDNLMINESARQQVIYDLSGRRVNNAQKGIYIINGKKVIK